MSRRKRAIRLAHQPTVNFYELAGLIVHLHDREAIQVLRASLEGDGWTVAIVWECEVKKIGHVAGLLKDLANRTPSAPARPEVRTGGQAPDLAGLT